VLVVPEDARIDPAELVVPELTTSPIVPVQPGPGFEHSYSV
jgi:hypothetical protein